MIKFLVHLYNITIKHSKDFDNERKTGHELRLKAYFYNC
ncbi:hypothetical protein P343_09760 [Sporolactobacillus laevolacticus DSM 442]|uniref:Uncharacterized protein n=1 Tax=Sporolactobacillus laevolacticus DSM 442 TaxID=1395513 RepID=V6IXG8_9BACL|nr:hypothetical protein P343_09760 [Sporolactobacillus laevolacticus DSM 442]